MLEQPMCPMTKESSRLQHYTYIVKQSGNDGSTIDTSRHMINTIGLYWITIRPIIWLKRQLKEDEFAKCSEEDGLLIY